MDTTYVNILLAFAVIVVPLGLSGLLLELRERKLRNPKNRHRGGTSDCGIINSNHPADGQ